MPPQSPRVEPRPIHPPTDWREQLGGFHREVGFSIEPAETHDGTCVVSGKVEARHLNVNQVVHGGVFVTILDTAMGGAVVTLLDENESTATTSLYVEFLRPGREGQILRAKGEVVRRGRHLAFAEGNLFDGDGRRLSQAHGTWYIWSSSDTTWSGRSGSGRPPPHPAPRRKRS
ncbi:MAG: PaaI family thioesterase [Thermoplasmata archaeon]|nr:PaaI family thioesterase [Thermoplasmata archaeon]